MDINELLADILSGRKKQVILDTDTYNEVDDQFALAYAMLSKDKIDLLSVNAAPFYNMRSDSPEDGMLKSYDEILRIAELTEPGSSIPVYKGSRCYLSDVKTPEDSPAADNIINTALSSSERVWVVAIGCITNVASALLKNPRIKENVAVVWLGGNAWRFNDSSEFNLRQDIAAASVIFNSGVPFVQIPCRGVTDMLMTTAPELAYYIGGKNKLGDYLTDIVSNYFPGNYARSKVIWDISAVACLTLPGCMDRSIVKAPYMEIDGSLSVSEEERYMIIAEHLNRDAIFADVFKKIANKDIK